MAGSCPSCGGSNIEFLRERVGSNYVNTANTTGVTKGRGVGLVGGGILVGSGKKRSSSQSFGQGVTNIAYKTTGVCHDCGYTWVTSTDIKEPEPEKKLFGILPRNFWGWLCALAFWPVLICVPLCKLAYKGFVWYFTTEDIPIDKTKRWLVIAGVFVFCILIGILFGEPVQT